MAPDMLAQFAVALLYLSAAILLLPSWRGRGGAIPLASAGLLLHLILLVVRWKSMGQIPIVTRYEDLTVDALAVVGVYLAVQWRLPRLRVAGMTALPLAAVGVLAALLYGRGGYPMSPALRTNWLIAHAELNSLAIGVGTLAAGTIAAWLCRRSPDRELALLAGRLTAWAFFFWGAMVAAGSYWASLAWGRYWGWDPIESWSMGTLLAYAFVLHLRVRPGFLSHKWAATALLLPYVMMLFTTYGLLMVMSSIHGQYLFQ